MLVKSFSPSFQRNLLKIFVHKSIQFWNPHTFLNEFTVSYLGQVSKTLFLKFCKIKGWKTKPVRPISVEAVMLASSPAVYSALVQVSTKPYFLYSIFGWICLTSLIFYCTFTLFYVFSPHFHLILWLMLLPKTAKLGIVTDIVTQTGNFPLSKSFGSSILKTFTLLRFWFAGRPSIERD